MSLPKSLITSFERIKSLDLLNLNNETIQSFATELNRAIPSAMNPVLYAVYRFNRTRYISDRDRFIKEIKDFGEYESMILWTDYKDILEYFGLTGKIYLGWDKKTNRYRAYSTNETNTQPIAAPPSSPTEIDIIENAQNDMDLVFDYMQKRLADLKVQTLESQMHV